MDLEFSTVLGVKNTICRLLFQIRLHVPLKDGNAIFVHQWVRHREVTQEISWNNLKCNETSKSNKKARDKKSSSF